MAATRWCYRRVVRKAVKIPSSRPMSIDLDGWAYRVEDDEGELEETPL